jgi:CHAT domain-containing protein
VAASLWRVSDRSTAALMSRFYARLRAGLPAAEALAAAQAELAAGPVAPPAPPPAGLFGGLARRFGLAPEPPPEDFTHPFHWAAFRLDGDWR